MLSFLLWFETSVVVPRLQVGAKTFQFLMPGPRPHHLAQCLRGLKKCSVSPGDSEVL